LKAPVILPVPCFNVINGGEHAGNRLPMQEFMILPTGAKSFTEAMQIGTEVYHNLKNVIKKKYGTDGKKIIFYKYEKMLILFKATNVGDEGGFAPNIQDPKEALDLLVTAIKNAGHDGKVKIAMDVAASEFYKDGKYDLDFKNPNSKGESVVDGAGLVALYQKWIKEYGSKDASLKFGIGIDLILFVVVSIEDGFDQDDWTNWSALTSSTGIQIVGDDLTVTNPVRIQDAITKKACNGLLLKVNQIGTLTESIEA